MIYNLTWKLLKTRTFSSLKISNKNFSTFKLPKSIISSVQKHSTICGHVTIFYIEADERKLKRFHLFIYQKKLVFPPRRKLSFTYVEGRRWRILRPVSPNKDESPLCRRSCRDIMKHLRFTKVFDVIVSIAYEIRNKDALYFITSFS